MTKYILIGLFICGCSPTSPLPSGYETCRLEDGWYLRTNGVFLRDHRYFSKDEAVADAYKMAGMRSAPPNSTIGVSDPNHLKLDAVLSQTLTTNNYDTFETNGDIYIAHSHHPVVRQVWIEFRVYDAPFKALLREETLSDEVVK